MVATIKADVHSLSVVLNRISDFTATGKVTYKEQWVKAAILGGEGSIADKFNLLFNSRLQFKVSTALRERDARANDTYYPRGSECAQLFSVLADMIGVVPMDGFEAQKWADRMPKGYLAKLRLIEYVESITDTAKQSEKPKRQRKNRLTTDETIPATEAPTIDATVNGEAVPV